MHSRRLAIHDVRLVGRKDATSLGDFPAFSNGMIVATQALANQFLSDIRSCTCVLHYLFVNVLPY